jgi:hypothetical protein
MASVYSVNESGSANQLKRVRCRNEEQELQRLLEQNPDLLPGDQIRPDDPRRWLLIKNEMPVQDPSTGGDRWSVDLVFVDQSGIPTFVECKRFSDTRSRREVVAQMIEYAANGHYYWTRDMFRQFATDAAEKRGSTLAEELLALQPDCGDDEAGFLESIENNLREGQVRLVFFLEEAPQELKSIVDFLNRQMERTEVLIVEAQQFEQSNGNRLVVPSLFGYSEDARAVKRTVTVSGQPKKKWNKKAFFESVDSQLDAEGRAAVRELYSALSQMTGVALRWGSSQQGFVNVYASDISTRSFMSFGPDGLLYFNFANLKDAGAQIELREGLAEMAKTDAQLAIQSEPLEKYPSFKVKEWGSKSRELANGIKRLLSNRKALEAAT